MCVYVSCFHLLKINSNYHVLRNVIHLQIKRIKWRQTKKKQQKTKVKRRYTGMINIIERFEYRNLIDIFNGFEGYKEVKLIQFYCCFQSELLVQIAWPNLFKFFFFIFCSLWILYIINCFDEFCRLFSLFF